MGENVEEEILEEFIEEETIEVDTYVDYTQYLEEIKAQLDTLDTRLEIVETYQAKQVELQTYISGICIFAVVVALCVFSYKFFRIFF